MNLFKKYYPVVKNELKKYKPIPENTSEEFQSADGAYKWNMLIHEYLERCDDEERKFIDLLYFKNNPICDVGIIFPLSIRACQEWREEILKNLVLLAANNGLMDSAAF